MAEKLKILIVDDTSFMRRAIRQILEIDPGLEVLGTAKNGLEAVKKAAELKPDVITMDIDMPVMDGLSAIRHIMVETPIPIVALSSLVSDGAITFEALRLGVVDFVPKPSGAISLDIDKSKQQVIDRIKVANAVNLDNVRRVKLTGGWDVHQRLDSSLYKYHPLDHVIALGTSLSGPNTVIRLLSKLSPTLPAAVVVVQEISPKIISSFAKQFNENVPWRVQVAEGEIPMEQGTCYISSNEHSIEFSQNEKGEFLLKSGEGVKEPLNLLFSTAAETFQQNTVGVLLTGIGDDGEEGFKMIRKKSGVTMAQDALCCVYPNLTDNAIKKGLVDMVVDETKLPHAIEAVME
ncbi:MAG: response regulator [Deltaproteobacteria bacterium]|nr:response regulator [Deltaproteobacteria bacterium]